MVVVKAKTGMSTFSLHDSAATKNVILLKYYSSFLTSVKKHQTSLQIPCLRWLLNANFKQFSQVSLNQNLKSDWNKGGAES